MKTCMWCSGLCVNPIVFIHDNTAFHYHSDCYPDFEAAFYRAEVRSRIHVLLYQLDLDWEHPMIANWAAYRGTEFTRLTLEDLNALKADLERVLRVLESEPLEVAHD